MRPAPPLLALALFAAPALAQSTWLVDDDGGVGVHFTEVSAAIAAASGGDVILVKDGSYGSVVVHAKSLTIAADQGAQVDVAGASVRGLAASQRVRLDGLHMRSTFASAEAGLQVKNNQGAVWIEDCRITGADGDGTMASPTSHPDGHPALEVVDSVAVTVARCDLFGGHGSDYAVLAVSPGGGGPAVTLAGAASGLALFDSSLTGGDAGDVFDDDAAWGGPYGGDCVEVEGGELFAIGNLMQSGDGGVAGEDFDIWVGYSCADGGDAGSGIAEPWGAVGPILLHLADNAFTSGTPGPPYPGASCAVGSPGSTLDVTTAVVDAMPIDAYSLEVTDPVREGEVVGLLVEGPPLAHLWLAVSGGPGWLHLPTLGGLLLLDPADFTMFKLGIIDPVGHTTAGFNAPHMAPPGQGLDLFLQVVGLDPATGRLSLGSPSGLLLLDAAL